VIVPRDGFLRVLKRLLGLYGETIEVGHIFTFIYYTKSFNISKLIH
jgi:hypothetical protein